MQIRWIELSNTQMRNNKIRYLFVGIDLIKNNGEIKALTCHARIFLGKSNVKKHEKNG